ncbi:MAG: hypothetical protein WC758_03405 [Candidatus Woesearchaeota archaeon]|jgi:hypothetical protein
MQDTYAQRTKYRTYFTKHKDIAFMKNATLGMVAGMSTGYVISDLADSLLNNNAAAATIGTLTDYLADFVTVGAFHALDNKDIYTKKNGKFNWKYFIKDQVKFAGAFMLIDLMYLTGKPFIQREYMDAGQTAGASSLHADTILYPILIALEYAAAKITRFIKPKPQMNTKKITQRQKKSIPNIETIITSTPNYSNISMPIAQNKSIDFLFNITSFNQYTTTHPEFFETEPLDPIASQLEEQRTYDEQRHTQTILQTHKYKSTPRQIRHHKKSRRNRHH